MAIYKGKFHLRQGFSSRFEMSIAASCRSILGDTQVETPLGKPVISIPFTRVDGGE